MQTTTSTAAAAAAQATAPTPTPTPTETRLLGILATIAADAQDALQDFRSATALTLTDVATAAAAITPPAPGQPWPAQGGTYIGIAPAEGNLPARHLVALDIVPDTDDGELTWRDAVKWAESHGNGARLPTQLEALFAFTTAKAAFKPVYHWTLTQGSPNFAFVQDFEYGYSYWHFKGSEFRVRPFRGLALQTFTPLTDAPTHCSRGVA